MTCVRCGMEFKLNDDVVGWKNQDPDFDWRNNHNDRCYRCHLRFTYELYGSDMEPVFGFSTDQLPKE